MRSNFEFCPGTSMEEDGDLISLRVSEIQSNLLYFNCAFYYKIRSFITADRRNVPR